MTPSWSAISRECIGREAVARHPMISARDGNGLAMAFSFTRASSSLPPTIVLGLSGCATATTCF